MESLRTKINRRDCIVFGFIIISALFLVLIPLYPPDGVYRYYKTKASINKFGGKHDSYNYAPYLIRNINLSGGKIDDHSFAHLVNIGGLTGLESLDLSNTSIGDQALPQILKLTKLRDLNLSGTRITDKGIQVFLPLCHVRHLNLSGTDISDAGLESMPNGTIKKLSLHHTKTSLNKVEELRQSGMEILHVAPSIGP